MNYTVVSPLDYIDENILGYNLKTRRKNKFIRGGLYKLKQKVFIDSSISSTFEKTYRLIGIVHQIGKMEFKGVVMKQLTGERSNMTFTLSKSQCKALHIKYQKGLEVFPMETKFTRIVERFPNDINTVYDKNDFSTYQHCPIDGTIRQIFVRLDDLEKIESKKSLKLRDKKTKKYYNILLKKKEYPTENDTPYIGGLTVKTKEHLKAQDFADRYYEPKVVVRKNTELDYFITIEKDASVMMVITLCSPVVGGFTEDGFIGIDKNLLKGKSFEDLFEIIDIKENK